MSKDQPKEHYVPQRYLNYFACNIGKIKKIHVYDKTSKEIRKNQPINRLACEGGFYDIDYDDFLQESKEYKLEINQLALDFLRNYGEDYTDKFLSNLVEPSFDVIDELITQYITGMLSHDSPIDFLKIRPKRNQISYYIVFQYLRTQAFRDYLLDLINKIRIPIITKNSETIKLLQARLFFDTNFVSTKTELINSGVWILGKVRSNKVLYTSDNPIHVIPDVDKEPGILQNIIQVTYPLLPDMILIILSPKTAIRNEFTPFENQIVELKDEAVDYFNCQRVSGATRYVLCSEKQLENASNMHSDIDKLSKKEQILKFYTLGEKRSN